MPLPTFNPPMRPSPGTLNTPEVKLREAPFGDGYAQKSPSGLNHIRRVLTFKWEYLTLEQARAIDTFLTARGGYRPFYYSINGESTARKWTCSEWSVTDDHPAKVQATFREDFTTAT